MKYKILIKTTSQHVTNSKVSIHKLLHNQVTTKGSIRRNQYLKIKIIIIN